MPVIRARLRTPPTGRAVRSGGTVHISPSPLTPVVAPRAANWPTAASAGRGDGSSRPRILSPRRAARAHGRRRSGCGRPRPRSARRSGRRRPRPPWRAVVGRAHGEPAAGPESGARPLEQAARPQQVLDHLEGDDRVERFGLHRPRQLLDRVPDEPMLGVARRGVLDGLGGELHPDRLEPLGRKRGDEVAGPGADVEHASCARPPAEARGRSRASWARAGRRRAGGSGLPQYSS